MKRLALVVVSAVLTLGCPGEPGAPTCPQPEVLSGTLSGEVVLGDVCSNWIASSTVTVPADAKLVIRPGVVLSFASGTRLLVNGKLEAPGTADAPIILTGAEKTPGFWDGVVLQHASSAENKLAHVTIEYAGGSKFSWANAPAGLSLVGSAEKPSRITVEHSTLRHNKGYGLELDANSFLTGFTGNTLTTNTLGAAHALPVGVEQLATGNTYTGNTKDLVVVDDGTVRNSVVTLRAIGIPYLLGAIDVGVDGTLSFEAGVTARFRSGGFVEATEGSKLIAAGTASAPITLTGEESTPGFWKGVLVYGSASTENVLANVVVEYAGVKHSWAEAAANVQVIRENSRLRIVDSVLRHGAGFGLYVDGKAPFGEFTGNTLTENAQGAAYVTANSAHLLGAGNSYRGNASGKDFVRVATDTIRGEVTWAALDVPYRAQKVTVDGTLTILPGARLEFDANGQLYVAAAGRLVAVGTGSELIIFTKAPDVARWDGIHFYMTPNPNRVEYAEVAFGGATKFSWADEKAGLSSYRSSVSVANTRFSSNGGYGLWFDSLSTVTGACDTANYESNELGPTKPACP